MAQYNVQDPQGNMRVIEGPDGASDEEVIKQAQTLFGASGGLNPTTAGNDTNTLNTIRQHISPASFVAQQVADLTPARGLRKLITAAFPDPSTQTPQGSFNQDVKTGNAQDTTLNDAATVQAVVTAPSALRSVGGLADAGASKVINFLKTLASTPSTAESLAPVESALEAGLNAKSALATEKAAAKSVSNKLYDAIPKDIQVPTSTAQAAADTIINEVKDLPSSFQSKKILSITGDIQNMDKATVPTIQSMQSALKDMAVNGDGVEKVYAARLSNALRSDLESFSKTPIAPPISQGPSLEAQDLRSLWGKAAREQSGASEDIIAPYVKPDTFQPAVSPSALNNSDVSANLNKANSYYRDMSQLYNHPISKALETARPEEAMAVVFKRGNVDDVNVAKSALGPVGYKNLQGQFYQKLLDSKNLGTTLTKYSPEFLHEALGPQRVEALQALAHFKQLVSKAAFGGKVAAGAVGAGAVYETTRHLLH